MKKIATLFLLAILAPSLVMAWVAVRSLQGQQFVFERQQALLYQGTTDQVAAQMRHAMTGLQNEFGQQVEVILSDQNPRDLAPQFDERLRQTWSPAGVGFVVSLDGAIFSPSSVGDAAAVRFRQENGAFLSNREAAEVFAAKNQYAVNTLQQTLDAGARANLRDQQALEPAAAPPARTAAVGGAGGDGSVKQNEDQQALTARTEKVSEVGEMKSNRRSQKAAGAIDEAEPISSVGAVDGTKKEDKPEGRIDHGQPLPQAAGLESGPESNQALQKNKSADVWSAKLFSRNVMPQKELKTNTAQLSLSQAAEVDFSHIVGPDMSGWLARYLQNRLNLMVWYRSPRDPQLVFGAQLQLNRVKETLTALLAADYGLERDICLALLDDNGKPVAQTVPDFVTDWKRPFVATEIGDQVPHWEVGVYLLDPEKFTKSARDLKWSLRGMVALMLGAIVLGGSLMVADVRRQLAVARQKTDFVSNVSHELKTPLTSIRMFSELWAEGKVTEPEKGRHYAGIIAAEASRLTRLINNVLDFSRMERGEKKYDLQRVEMMELVRQTVENYRPHLEANGFQVTLRGTEEPGWVQADRDAVAQILLNLLSNAEKYGGEAKQIEVEAEAGDDRVRVAVMDRGAGVPRGEEEKIFEQFHRAHDSLSSGIQGSGLGLTLARQMARAHGGEVKYNLRPGGGSVFLLEWPKL